LLHGPRGVGKRALAEHYARALVCEADTQRRPCGRCESCRWAQAGTHPDLRVIEPEARQTPRGAADEPSAKPAKPSYEIRIEQIRELGPFLALGSHRERRRVAILHPAEEMNLHSANALLKALEEPPGAAMFLLVSDRASRLLPTIRSRCVPLGLGLPPREAALKWLARQRVEEPERWLSYAGGAPLRALEYARGPRSELLGQLLAAESLDALRDARRLVDREDLELFAEFLQKAAFDQALAAFGFSARFGTRLKAGAGDAGRERLKIARQMGAERLALRQPLNPALFVESSLAAMEGQR
jgi:DNA polymerase-3 subunit delta'